MRHIENFRDYFLLSAMVSLSACAATGTIIDSPSVNLTGVEFTSANFRRQTFVLSFDVSNPNPFPLPVKSVAYQEKWSPNFGQGCKVEFAQLRGPYDDGETTQFFT